MATAVSLGRAYVEVRANADQVGPDVEQKLDASLKSLADNAEERLQDVADDADAAARQMGDSFEEQSTRARDVLGDRFKGVDFTDVSDKSADAANRLAASWGDGSRQSVNALNRIVRATDDSGAEIAQVFDRATGEMTQAFRGTADDVDRALGRIGGGRITEIENAVHRLDGQTATVDVRVNDSGLDGIAGRAGSALGGMQLLTTAAIAVGPALIAIGAAAAIGIGAISGLAAGAVAGLGVLAVGFAGVSNAVKLLGKRQDALATQSAGAGAAGASSARQIASAQASLANTQATAAEAAVKAAEKVVRAREEERRTELDVARDIEDATKDLARAREDAAEQVQDALDRQAQAERSLSRDLRDEQDAVLGLTNARREAQQQLEELASSLADNGLAQRQAVFDVAEARRQLDVVLANPFARKAEAAQAQLNYEQELKRQQDLARRGEQLQQEQADAAAKGVDGSDLVTEATRRLQEAQQAVIDSTRNAAQADADVTKARRDSADQVADAAQKLAQTQEDGARRVVDAQRSVTDALRDQEEQARQSAFSISQAQAAAAAAATSAGAAGVSALAGIDAELAKVNPATLAFAGFVQDRLMPAWEQIKGAAAGGVLPGAQAGLEALMPLLPQITGFFSSLAAVIGGTLADAGRELASPFWVDFFTQLQTVAGPAIRDIYDASINVARGFAGMLEAFFPFADEFGGGIVDLTAKFAAWGQGLADSQGFHDFVDFVRTNWPAIAELFSNVGELIGNLVKAGGGLAGPTLTVLGSLVRVLASLDPSTLQTLLVTFLAFRGVAQVTGTLGSVVKSARDARDTFHALGDAVSSTRDFLTGLPDKLGKLNLAQRAQAAGAKVAAAGQWLLNAAMSANPIALIVIAIAALVAGFIIAYKHSETFREIVDAALRAVGDAAQWLWDKFLELVDFFTGLPGRIGDALGGLGQRVSDIFTGAVTWVRDTVSTGFNAIVDFVTGIPERFVRGLEKIGAFVADIFRNLVSGARDLLVNGFNGLVDFVAGIPGRIASLGSKFLDAGKNIISGIVDGIGAAAGFVGDVGKNIVNSVIGFVNSQVIDRVNSLLEFKVAGITINPPDIPRIPKLADGGVFDRPTLAVIGEAGREAVVPLTRPDRRDAVMAQAGLGGGEVVDGGFTYAPTYQLTTAPSQNSEEVGAAIEQRTLRDLRTTVTSRYRRPAA